jgi:hypothetical protein
MKHKKADRNEVSQQEMQLLALLRQHPQIRQRVESILEIASNTEGPLKTADEVEDLLIQEIRRLGHATMSQWAAGAEERVSQDLKSQDATVRSRKKKR